MNTQATAERINAILDEVETVIVGKRRAVELVVIGLLGNGHILIEDIPGVGKTMLARAVSLALGVEYRRIQFTPDLLPADITGVSIYNQKTSEFEFRPGPVFTNILLADEINRATPKTQSSLLECMGEFQVSADGVTRPLPRPFFVIATENSIEYRGTFPLPEAQLDRFLMRLGMGYPTPDEEVTILERQMHEHPIGKVRPVLTVEDIVALQEAIKEVYLEDSLKHYIVSLVDATRRSAGITLGASPRGSIALMRCSQANAAMNARDFVTPDDVKLLAEPVLIHRLILKPDARVKGLRPAQIIEEVLHTIPVPVLQEAA